MAKRVALVTGATGQDGAYLAEFLLNKGYVVHGLKRRSSSFNTGRVDHLYQDPHDTGLRFVLHYGDMTDATNLIRIVQDTQPEEIYNLACRSRLKHRNILRMLMALGPYGCLRLFEFLGWKNA
jgi:GDPmannose 4,6-dehydratase